MSTITRFQQSDASDNIEVQTLSCRQCDHSQANCARALHFQAKVSARRCAHRAVLLRNSIFSERNGSEKRNERTGIMASLVQYSYDTLTFVYNAVFYYGVYWLADKLRGGAQWEMDTFSKAKT